MTPSSFSQVKLPWDNDEQSILLEINLEADSMPSMLHNNVGVQVDVSKGPVS